MELGALCPFKIRVLFAIPTQQKVNSKIQFLFRLTQMLLKASLRTMVVFKLLSEFNSSFIIAASL